MAQPKILIVDDDKEARSVLAQSLSRRLDCQVFEAASGRDALGFFGKEEFDLVILDIKMPGLSGVDILRKIKENNPQTDFIMLSAYDASSIAIQAFQEGALDYITKPASIEVIYDKVSSALSKKGKFFTKEKKKD